MDDDIEAGAIQSHFAQLLNIRPIHVRRSLRGRLTWTWWRAHAVHSTVLWQQEDCRLGQPTPRAPVHRDLIEAS